MPQGNDAVKLNGKRTFTAEGYLVAPAVLAKSGILPYYAQELDLKDRAPNAIVQVYRSREELARSAPTFEGKPITLDHPPDGVDASTWRELAVGDVHDVLPQDDTMHATVIVRDKAAIEEVKKGRRQLSNGYSFELRPAPAGTKRYEFEQVDIRGNHIAIVDRARCGPSCVVGDRDPITEEREVPKLMVKVTVDGYPCEMDDTAAVAVKKLEQRLTDAQAQLAQPPKLKIGDKVVDQAGLDGELQVRDKRIKELEETALTPEKIRAEIKAEQQLLSNIKDMLPTLEIADGADLSAISIEALKQLEDADAAVKAQIAAVLDGIAIDKAKPADLQRALRTVHASRAADRKGANHQSRNTNLGRAIFSGKDRKQDQHLDGRDAYVHRITHMQDEKPGQSCRKKFNFPTQDTHWRNSMADEKQKAPQHDPKEHDPKATQLQSRPGRTGVAEKEGVEARVATFPATDDIWPRPPLDFTGFGDINTAGYEFAPGFPGKIVDTGIKDQISRVPESAVAFGVFVQEGTKQGYCKAAGSGAGRVLGVSVYDWTAGAADPATGTLGYAANHWSVGILRVGRIWCLPKTAVQRGMPATYDTADGTPSAGGVGGPVEGATWDTDAAAGELAVLQLNLIQ